MQGDGLFMVYIMILPPVYTRDAIDIYHAISTIREYCTYRGFSDHMYISGINTVWSGDWIGNTRGDLATKIVNLFSKYISY